MRREGEKEEWCGQEGEGEGEEGGEGVGERKRETGYGERGREGRMGGRIRWCHTLLLPIQMGIKQRNC